MDAATLYMIVTLPNGAQSTSTVEFGTLQACEQKTAWFQLIERRKSPRAVTSVRCAEHKIRPGFYLSAYDWRGHPRGLHMRDRGLPARCYEQPRSSDDAEPKWEPDGLDMRGQPGVPKAQ